MRTSTLRIALAAAALAGGSASAATGAAEHAAIAAYDGTKTCAACHAKAVKDVARSLHYQQQGATPFLGEAGAACCAGMMVSY